MTGVARRQTNMRIITTVSAAAATAMERNKDIL